MIWLYKSVHAMPVHVHKQPLPTQDRIASLNGRSVDLVLRQQRAAFVRLIGMSVLQSAASAVLAPSLRHVADVLALRWRQQLTRRAHKTYLQVCLPLSMKQNCFRRLSVAVLLWQAVWNLGGWGFVVFTVCATFPIDKKHQQRVATHTPTPQHTHPTGQCILHNCAARRHERC